MSIWNRLIGFRLIEAPVSDMFTILLFEGEGKRVLLMDRAYRPGCWHVLDDVTQEEIQCAKTNPWTLWNSDRGQCEEDL